MFLSLAHSLSLVGVGVCVGVSGIIQLVANYLQKFTCVIAADFSAVQFHFIRLVDLQFKIVLSLIGVSNVLAWCCVLLRLNIC